MSRSSSNRVRQKMPRSLTVKERKKNMINCQSCICSSWNMSVYFFKWCCHDWANNNSSSGSLKYIHLFKLNCHHWKITFRHTSGMKSSFYTCWQNLSPLRLHTYKIIEVKYSKKKQNQRRRRRKIRKKLVYVNIQGVQS